MSFLTLAIFMFLLLLIYGRANTDLFKKQDRRLTSQRMPIFSASTTNNKEAEFIRERLQNRRKQTTVLMILLLTSAVGFLLIAMG